MSENVVSTLYYPVEREVEKKIEKELKRRRSSIKPINERRVLKIPEFGQYATVKECEIKNYESMLKECYEARGWNENGVPKPEKLKELELEWVMNYV